MGGRNRENDMQLKYIWKSAVLAGVMGSVIFSAGCSRSTMNYQLAESIGTVGKYENNEPVETPKMEQARLQRESEEAREKEIQAYLDEAAVLAKGYRYGDAAAVLQSISEELAEDERIGAAIVTYQEAEEDLVVYEGDIAHLCFPGLVEDTMRAFDGDELSYNYSNYMTTTDEFKGILQSLYDNGYILVDLHDVAREETDDRGVTTVEKQELRLPAGKKPVIISQDNLNYASVRNGDGIATKLVLDEDGKVKALYTDEGGHDLKGDYDLVPILDTFVEEHPDFSLKGAKGIVSVSGSEGVFGYPVADTSVTSYEENRTIVTQIAETMKENGWTIACASYSHSYMDEMSVETLEADLEQWMEEVGTLVGPVDVLFYPYGAEVDDPSDQLDVLLDKGLVYLCGLWAAEDYMELGDGYMRQTRRFIDGVTLQQASNYFDNFFNVAQILDTDR